MRTAAITVTVVLAAALVLWILEGTEVGHIADLLPLVSGESPSQVYSLGGVAVLVITLWGLLRLLRHGQDDE